MPGTLEESAVAISRVISICRDAEQGFRGAANASRDADLKELFVQYSEQHGRFAAKLQEAVKALGYDAESPAGLGGTIYGGLINLKALMTSHDQHGILVEAERGEDWILSAYREAMDKSLPVGVRHIIEEQLGAIEKAHDYLKNRRDATDPKRQTSATD
jgi:uncharacterized protein (TIGR02284 family)